ncbi:MAG: hypothetical protein BWY78_00313 [Alphaproteobacteria bacterium ADurb.Bin438]|nr:MAG: hypothetical protein BWY78_00313 [Alphaproteobacteria bacterium ADurb.Bin438]
MEILVKNMKDDDIKINLKQSLPIDCKVEHESHKSFKENVADFNWDIIVKKQSNEKLIVKFNFKDASKK